MKTLPKFLSAALLAGAATVSLAATNPLSVHVLNLQDGLPSPGVVVVLEKQSGKGWTELNKDVTNEQGRIPALFPAGAPLEKGNYRVTFQTGDWFAKHDMKTFFPEVPVIFAVDGAVAHYHIPLQVSPYGFSTYRGN